MTPDQYIYERLAAHAGLVALVGTRISAGIAEQGCARPYLTYQVVGARPEYTHDGPEEMRDPECQFDAVADTYDGAWAVNAQLMAVLEASDSPMVDAYIMILDDGTYDREEYARTGFHRVMSRATVWFRKQ